MKEVEIIFQVHQKVLIPDELTKDSRDLLFMIPYWGEAPDNVIATHNGLFKTMAKMGGPYDVQFISSDIKLIDYKELSGIDKLPDFSDEDELKKTIEFFNDVMEKGLQLGEEIAKEEDLRNSPINKRLAEDIKKEIGEN